MIEDDLSISYERPVTPTELQQYNPDAWEFGSPTCTITIKNADKYPDLLDKLRSVFTGTPSKFDALAQAVRDFLSVLDIVEDSELSGKEFHPNTIRSCRAMDAERMNALLKLMKEYSK